MALHKTDFALFPEEYLLEEEEMGESEAQFQLIGYLVAVLQWMLRAENWKVSGNLEISHRGVRNSQHKITPDISVFKNVTMTPQEKWKLTSWNIERSRVAPAVVFEISSNSTWRSDVMPGENDKPAIYERIGVKEYFAFDPNDPPAWRDTNGVRLLGWRYENGQAVALQPDEQGRLWSEELDSWLKEDGLFLRLYDRENNLRLTESEANKRDKEAIKQENDLKDQRIAELERIVRELKRDSNQ